MRSNLHKSSTSIIVILALLGMSSLFTLARASLTSLAAASTATTRRAGWGGARLLPTSHAAFAPPASCRSFRMTPRCGMPRSGITIPHDRLEFSYSKSSGPGGQNVNKLNTRVELRFLVESAEWIPQGMRGRFLEQQRHRVNKAGELVLSSQEHRTQLKNREDCLAKLEEALARAAIVPKTRNMRVGLQEWEKENRLREKKKRSETKSGRRQNSKWDD